MINFFRLSHTLKRNLTKLILCSEGKSQNLKSSYLCYFMEKNDEIELKIQIWLFHNFME